MLAAACRVVYLWQSPLREKTMTESSILLQRDGAIARLTLNRPDRLNALTLAMLGELSAALSDLDGDETVRAVVLTGTGRGFCAGQRSEEQRLNSSHGYISYAVFCLKKKKHLTRS